MSGKKPYKTFRVQCQTNESRFTELKVEQDIIIIIIIN